MDVSIPSVLSNAKVTDLVDSNDDWNYSVVERLDAWSDFAETSFDYASKYQWGEDLSVWLGEVHGELLCSSEFKDSHDLWIKIWKLKVQERIKFFQWLAIRGRLMTNFQKYVMRLVVLVVICVGQSQKLFYMFLFCYRSRIIFSLVSCCNGSNLTCLCSMIVC